MGNGVKARWIGVALGGAMVLVSGCKGGEATPTERLWVSAVPLKPTDQLSAFATMRSDEGTYVGAFYQGSVLRGSHDVFKWVDGSKGKARIELLQDGRKIQLTLRPCEPTTGFDYCLEVQGDPTGAVTYYSRKRWVVKRPGRKRDVVAGLFSTVVTELAEDDEELAAVLDAAAEVVEP